MTDSQSSRGRQEGSASNANSFSARPLAGSRGTLLLRGIKGKRAERERKGREMHQIRFRLGLRPYPAEGAFNASPDPVDGLRFKGDTH